MLSIYKICGKHDKKAKYYFWISSHKQWSVEILKKKWTNDLPSSGYFISKIEKDHPLFEPGSSDNEEKYMEFLVKLKDKKRKKMIVNF